MAQTVSVFIAGYETSGLTISFTLLELAKHPEIQARVRKEIQDKIGEGDIIYENLNSLTYMQQVISESLRLYPPVPVINRINSQDYIVSEVMSRREKILL